MKISVTTVQHGFALEIGNKSWLLEDEMKLAEAVVFRIGMGFTEPLSKKKMQRLLQTMTTQGMRTAAGKGKMSGYRRNKYNH